MINPLPALAFLFCLLPTLSFSQIEPLRGTFVNCGATVSSVVNGQQWSADSGFISVGTPRNLSVEVQEPALSTLRTFPLQDNVFKKFCYEIPVVKGSKYLVRTTYFYGGVNRNQNPPVFDQIVDGTLWSVVNTTVDYLQGNASYYEAFFMAAGRNMSVCLGANNYTDSDPFISALELVIVANSLYNGTDFNVNALNLVARHSFGYTGPIVKYPDDQFNRYWEPFGQSNSTTPGNKDVLVSGFWNLPPLKVFQTNMEINQPEVMELKWPPLSLPNSLYYVSFYFADDRVSGSPRMFNISINGIIYFSNLSVTPAGVAVFANPWPLSGQTNITLAPVGGSSVGPLVNAGEAFQVLTLGGRTLARDVIALARLKESFKNPPVDWNGDPCFPRQYPWSGITCSEGPRVRVTFLNLTNMALSGFLSPYIVNMTALSGISLGNNSLTGSIPDLSSLKFLQVLDLSDNRLGGEIPPSLGNLGKLNQFFVQNNNLTGQVPITLQGKPGLDFRFSGNPLLSSPPS